MQIAVIGASECTNNEYEDARALGQILARSGVIILTGGRGGVMEAACRGAMECGGFTVGVLPTTGGGNQYLAATIRTGLGHARNVVLVQSADVVIAIGGSYGTLSEIAVALKCGIPVIAIRSWDIPGVIRACNPEDAARRALSILSR